MIIEVRPGEVDRAPRRSCVFRRQSLVTLQRQCDAQSLHRTLGPVSLLLLGVGGIVGAGIFVLTGTAAASFAGPAVLISFALAGLACAFAALCYAELASALPVAGSSYSYCYVTLGEVPAWIMGWLMILEYGIAISLIATGFSGYFVSALSDAGVLVPALLTTSFVDSLATGHNLVFTTGHGINLPAVISVIIVTAFLLRGVSHSAFINSLIVVIKVGVLLAFVAVGAGRIDPSHWTPFVPPHEGGFAYGWPGILRGTSLIFFAYLGFETVSTAAAEARNPQRDMPFGILGSLFVCTLLYLAVALVLTGIVPYRELGVPDPIALAVNAIGIGWFGSLVKLCALVGLFSVMLGALYGQTRVFYAMAADGLLPAVFGRLHPVYRIPLRGTLIVGAAAAVIAGLLPISILADLASLGTGLAFAMVCVSVMWLRVTAPDLPRPFLVPFGGVWIGRAWIGLVPVLGVVFSMLMVAPLLADMVSKARTGNPIPALLLAGYLLLGAVIYLFYSLNHSKLRGL